MSVATLSETRVTDRTLAFTRDVVLREIWDTVFDHSPALAMMMGRLQNERFGPVAMNRRAKQTQTGGESVVVRHNLGENTTAKTLTGPWDEYDVDPSDTVRGSRSNWKHYSVSITVSDSDILINRGPEALSSLVRFETMNAMRSLADLLAGHFYDNGGVTTRITSLDDLAGTGSVQGLAPTTYGTFKSRGVSDRGTAAASVSFASGSFAAQGLDDMLTSYLNASEGAVQPEVGLCPYDVFRFYEGSLQPQMRYNSPNVANGGFEQLVFKRAPIFPDAKALAQTLFWINWDYVFLKVLEGADMSQGPFERISNQEARTSEIQLKAQLCAADRRFLNKMNTISA